MRVLREVFESFRTAFAMYSKIPVGRCKWEKENRKYVMIFFPWVGAVIGLLFWGSFQGFSYIEKLGYILPATLKGAWFTLLPILITGGIHMDGFLDTIDALSSWREPKERRRILKDPNAGAFAVIWGVLYFLIYFACMCDLKEPEGAFCISIGFMTSRMFSAFSVVSMKKAEGSGLTEIYYGENRFRWNEGILVLYYLLPIFGAGFISVYYYRFVDKIIRLYFFLLLCLYQYYYRMVSKKFEGLTGDLCGWFLQSCELLIAVVVTLYMIFLRGKNLI